MVQPREIEGLELEASAVEEVTRDFEETSEGQQLFDKANVVGVGVGTKVTNGVDTGQTCMKV